MATLAGDL